MVSYLAPSWSCTHPAVAVPPLCFSAPLVHLILRLTGRPLHSRCTLHVASMRIYRNCTRTVHLGSAVALHCAARTAGACSSLEELLFLFRVHCGGSSRLTIAMCSAHNHIARVSSLPNRFLTLLRDFVCVGVCVTYQHRGTINT